MRSLKYFFVSCVLTMLFGMFVNTAFAATYVWTAGTNYTSPSPDGACSAAMAAIFPSIAYTGVIIQTATQASCRGGPYNNHYITAYRSGDSCPEGQTYDSTTGECVAPEEPENPCSDKAGTSMPFSKSGSGADNYMSFTADGKFQIPSQSACYQGCLANTADQKCIANVNGAYQCRGTAWFTGTECGAGGESGTSTAIDTSETSDGPDPQTSITDKPCVYVTQSDGTQSCQSEQSSETEGQHCGTVNGVQKCIDTSPSKNGVEITTTVDTQTNGDGSTTTTKTDTATKTSCSGVNSCTSKTTTTTTVTNKGANGETTSSTSSCTGENCAKDAGDDQDGDGMDDCQIGGDCDDEFSAPEQEGDEPPGFGESVQSFMDRLGASPLLSSVTAISMPGGGSCNFPEGSTPIGTISMDSMCDLASTLDGLHAVFLAVWGLAAIRVFMSA